MPACLRSAGGSSRRGRSLRLRTLPHSLDGSPHGECRSRGNPTDRLCRTRLSWAGLRHRFRAAPLVCSLLLWLTLGAQAQSAPPPLATERERHDFSVWTAGATGEENTNSFAEAQLWSAGVFMGWVITPDAGNGWRQGALEYGFSLMPAFVQARPQQIFGGGFEPIVLRWNFRHHLRRLTPYIEMAGGGLFTNSNLPPGDTSSFNFTARAGGGIEVPTKKHQSFDIACRWAHISNANLGVRNTEFNGIQVSLGYRWFK